MNLRISKNRLEKAEDVVAHFGAMQAQDYPMSLWAIGMRMKNPDQNIIENSIRKGEIIRTHILRPTWHWVHQKDIRWMMELSAPYVKKATQYVDKKEGLSDELFKRSWKAIERQFSGNNDFTKENIITALANASITVSNLLATQIIIRAELEMLLCNGEKKGSYTFFEKKVPAVPRITKSEALHKLAHLYFTSRSPATAKDFAWWSGLSMSDARTGIAALGKQLDCFTHDNVTYYNLTTKKRIPTTATSVLLPAYDEYTVGYSEGRDVVLPANLDIAKIGNGIFKPLVLHKDEIIGTWSPEKKAPFCEIQILKKDRNLSKKKMLEVTEQYQRFRTITGKTDQ
jgi:hypothetical protein